MADRCGTMDRPEAATGVDIAFLTGLYTVKPREMGSQQRMAIASRCGGAGQGRRKMADARQAGTFASILIGVFSAALATDVPRRRGRPAAGRQRERRHRHRAAKPNPTVDQTTQFVRQRLPENSLRQYPRFRDAVCVRVLGLPDAFDAFIAAASSPSPIRSARRWPRPPTARPM